MTLMPFPLTVALELSSRCGLHCRYCDRTNWAGVNGSRSAPFMDVSLVRRIVDEVSLSPRTMLSLSFEGESLLHPDIAEILAIVADSGRPAWLTTTLPPQAEPHLSQMLQACSMICVSLAIDEDAYVADRGSDRSYAKSRELLHDLLARRPTVCSPSAVSVNATLPPELSLDNSRVRAFVSQWRSAVDDVYLWREMSYQPHEIRCRHDGHLTTHLRRRRVCMQPFRYVAVLSDGSLSPCCHTGRLGLAHVKVSEGLSAALVHPDYQAFLERHRHRDTAGLLCDNCDAWLEDWLGEETEMLPDGIAARHEGFSVHVPGCRSEVTRP